ncbi:MAG: GAF domain-containing protein [Anaerolineales bacterium]|nr:GAF domain-containing protein [Anaerolineales bacterium]
MSTKLPAKERVRASLELLYSISRELTSELDLGELLRRVLKLTLEKVAAESGSIIVLDEEGQLTEGAVVFEGEVHARTADKLVDPFERGLAGWVFEHRQAAFVPSTLDDDRWLQRVGEGIEKGSRSAISVPLNARDRVVGVLTMVHSQAGYFTEDDLTLLQAIADQAGVAVENARLFTAEQERRQLASTLQEIARTINSALDPTHVFSQILDQLARVVAYDSASIFVVQDDQLSLVAARGFSNEKAALALNIPIGPDLFTGQVLTTRKPMVMDDVQGDERWLKAEDLPESDLIRGWIGAPLIVRDRAVGVLSVDSHEVGAYGPIEVEVVSAFAEQAATAVANAQLFGESQRRVQALAALAYTARVVTASVDLDEVIERILQQTMTSLDAEAASVALLDETTDTLEFRFVGGKAANNLEGLRLERGQGIAGWVVEHNEPLVIPDVSKDPRFYPQVDEQTGFETRVIAAAPILAQTQTIGVLEAINPRDEIVGEEQLDLLMGIAYLAGSAIMRARLFSETQAAQQRYTSLFEDSMDPILITDMNGSITDTNRRADAFLGFARDELLGQSILNLKIPSADTLAGEVVDLNPGETLSFDNPTNHKDDDFLPIEVHVKRIDIDQQPFLQWILRDVSERIELDRLRADLTSMIFHDLRAPIGNIISSLEVLEASGPKDDEAFHSVFSIAQRSSRRASRLVESLLDLDRLEAGRAVLNRQETSIGTLIAEAVEEVHPMTEAKGHVLHFDLAPSLPKIEIDVDMILRVLTNLLENAIKYTRSGGRIAVSARQEKKKILVSVKDSGPGVSPSDQKRIFEKYARLHQEERPKGIGLGLAFCRLAVEAHGGSIWVESVEGEGSTFYFTLPL